VCFAGTKKDRPFLAVRQLASRISQKSREALKNYKKKILRLWHSRATVGVGFIPWLTERFRAVS